MQTIIKSPAGIAFNITGKSASTIAAMDGIKGSIGKTSILEMLRDHSIIRKGWIVSEYDDTPVPAIPSVVDGIKRANKLGIPRAKAGKRERKPMLIYYTPGDHLDDYLSRSSGDTRKMLSIVSRNPGIEAGELANKLNWSRDQVLMTVARFVTQGYVTKAKESNRVWRRV